MASTFGSLEIAKSGMMAYNAALQTTALTWQILKQKAIPNRQ